MEKNTESENIQGHITIIIPREVIIEFYSVLKEMYIYTVVFSSRMDLYRQILQTPD